MSIRVLPQHLTITGALALALCLLALLAAGSGQAHAAPDDYISGQVVVKVVSDAALYDIIHNDRYAGVERLDDVPDDLPDNLATENIYLLRAPDNYDAEAFVADLLAGSPTNGVVYAEPNYVAAVPEILAGDARFRARSPGYNKQPTEANEGNTTYDENLHLSCMRDDIKGTRVAVLDTGAQLNHPALQGNFRRVKRYDFVDNDATPSDEKFYRNGAGDRVRGQLAGHGTHVSGIVDQVAPGVKIMPLRVLDPRGLGDAYTVARAIAYAQRHEAHVINLSLGTSKHSKLLEEIVANATGDNIIVTAAAGNGDTRAPHYPAAGAYDGTGHPPFPFDPTEDGLVAVTSLQEDRVKSDFANFGPWVDIAAQGENIRSAYLGDRYATWSGTSMATPFISGEAALIRAVSSGPISSGNVELKIRDKADATIYAANEPGYLLRKELGAGQANVCGSIDREE